MKKVEVSESALESIKAMAAKLYEENEDLRADAERYRWILTQDGYITHSNPEIAQRLIDEGMRVNPYYAVLDKSK